MTVARKRLIPKTSHFCPYLRQASLGSDIEAFTQEKNPRYRDGARAVAITTPAYPDLRNIYGRIRRFLMGSKQRRGSPYSTAIARRHVSNSACWACLVWCNTLPSTEDAFRWHRKLYVHGSRVRPAAGTRVTRRPSAWPIGHQWTQRLAP